MKTTIHVSVYSPRWGHDDGYTISCSENEMSISNFGKEAICENIPPKDPIWKGYNDTTGNPLENILTNDGIYPPINFVDALETAWQSWINGELTDEQVKEEVSQLFDWLNSISKNKPNSEFWSKEF